MADHIVKRRQLTSVGGRETKRPVKVGELEVLLLARKFKACANRQRRAHVRRILREEARRQPRMRARGITYCTTLARDIERLLDLLMAIDDIDKERS